MQTLFERLEGDKMTKIVIIGSLKHSPYEIIKTPEPIPGADQSDEGYAIAAKDFYPAIDEADEVWVYAPDGMGVHTTLDYTYALQQGKTIRFLAKPIYLSNAFMERMFRKFYNQSIVVKERLKKLVQSLHRGDMKC